MAKIVVYEDSPTDAVIRYGPVARAHDVTVYIHNLSSLFHNGKLSDLDASDFTDEGFDPDKIKQLQPEEPIEDADLYFVDGLQGYCFTQLEKLPKSKTYLASGNIAIQSEAKSRGYKTTQPENLLELVSGALKQK